MTEEIIDPNKVADLDKSVARLGADYASLDTRVGGLEARSVTIEAGVNQLLQRGSGWEATKGMIPSSTVKWGVGAFLTIMGLGLVLLQIFLSSMRSDITEAKEFREKLGNGLRVTQDKTLVNQTKGEERYFQQLEWNKQKVDWNRRIVDRSLADRKEFLEADKELRRTLATKASTDDLRAVQRDQQVQISNLKIQLERYKAELEYVQLMQNRRYESIMSNTKRSGDHAARLQQAEEDLDKMWPTLIASAEKLGKLEPIIKGMGLTLPVGNEQRIMLLEKLLDAIDKEGSRGTNLRLKKATP